MILTFGEKEFARAEEFQKAHSRCLPDPYDGSWWRRLLRLPSLTSLPPHYSYEITETGIGKIVKIRCNYCGETLDITNYDLW